MRSTSGRPAEPLPELLDVKGVACVLGCSPSHVRRLAGDGRLPAAVAVGRLRRWPRRSIEQWVDAACRPAQAR